MTTGEKIRAARKDKGLTQKQLAEACGMADSAIRKYESGTQVPKMGTLIKIANALDVPFVKLGLSSEEQIELMEALQPSLQQLAKKLDELSFTEDDSTDKIIKDLFDSFDDSWGVLEPWAFFRDLSQTTGDEKRKIWEFVKFLKTQRKDDDTP